MMGGETSMRLSVTAQVLVLLLPSVAVKVTVVAPGPVTVAPAAGD